MKGKMLPKICEENINVQEVCYIDESELNLSSVSGVMLAKTGLKTFSLQYPV
jgi:hypothetical protein